MKKKDVEREISKLGWYFLREGGGHEIWTNGELNISLPRHVEINEWTAKGIIKKAKANLPKEKK